MRKNYQGKLFWAVLVLIFSGSAFLHAQIGMRLTAEHQCYLRYEPIEMTLLLRNYSGNTLVFGDQEGVRGKLSFNIVGQAQKLVTHLDAKVNPIADVILAAGASRELKLTLNHIFDMQRSDTYKVTAVLEHQRLPEAYVSDEITLEVRDGTVVSEKIIGIPSTNDRDLIRSLKASLMLFHESRSAIYCLRVEDEQHVYGTFRVGPFISGSKPQMEADAGSAIHVLVQVRPRVYSYAVYGLVGDMVKLRQQRYYKPNRGIPMLSTDLGYLKVLNVTPAQEGIDYRFDVANWTAKQDQ